MNINKNIATSKSKEGGLQAPIRHKLDWENESFFDMDDINKEMERVFDICHGCRRCFNLCDSFPSLFDMIDESSTGEVDGLNPHTDYKKIVDSCTLCDMCFMVKCPYVPPHDFNLDFPHLMLRYRAAEFKKNNYDKKQYQLIQTDRNAKLVGIAPRISNWMSNQKNSLTRGIMQSLLDIDKRAHLPKYEIKKYKPTIKQKENLNTNAPAFGEKVLLFNSCFSNYNDHKTLDDAIQVLNHNGIKVKTYYEKCCGMPFLEQGDIKQVIKNAEKISESLSKYINQGYTIVTPVSSCTLMFKFEWKNIISNNKYINQVSENTKDLSEYLVYINENYGLIEGLKPINAKIAVHISCHARAQNIGQQAAYLIKLIPEANIEIIERCSGHGGSWGYSKHNFDKTIKVGKPVFNQIIKSSCDHIASDCPLATIHIKQGIEMNQKGNTNNIIFNGHPVSLIAQSYGLLL